jgi:hypothetical protein
MTPTRLAAILLLATGMALAVVHQNARIRQAGYDLSGLYGQIAEQRAELAIHKAHLSKLKSPQRILALVEWLGLDLRERPVVPAGPQVAAAEEVPEAAEAALSGERSVAALPRY